MPRYYFHLRDHQRDTDDEGTELAGEAEARREAISFLGALMSDNPELIWDGREMRVRVEEDSGRVVCTVIALAVDGTTAST